MAGTIVVKPLVLPVCPGLHQMLYDYVFLQ